MGTEAVIYEVNGKALTLKEWAKLLGTSRKTIDRRLAMGWDIERAVTTPVDRRYPKPDGYWTDKIMNLERVQSGEDFTVFELARALKISQSAVKPHLDTLRRLEVFTEKKFANSQGDTFVSFRLRGNCSEILKTKWRTTDNDWLGLEPRLGVQW